LTQPRRERRISPFISAGAEDALFVRKVDLACRAFRSCPDVARASTVTVPGVGYSSITMDYTFNVGTPFDTFTVQSVAVTVGGPSSGYYGLLPEHIFFTGFTPLTAPACPASVCLDDFGVLNKGKAAGFNPPPIWAWFGSEQSFGYDSASGITIGTFVIDFYVDHSHAILADSAGAMSLLLPDGTKSGLDFNFGYPNGSPDAVNGIPEPSTWAMLLIGFAAIGFVSYLEIAATKLKSPTVI
jgi:hypothetical protein